MFQMFLRARDQTSFGDKPSKRAFKARSVERDSKTDHARVEMIVSAIESALAAAQAERIGLTARVDDCLARASVTFGNATDEYLTREPLDNYHQNLFDVEISNGQRRLQELSLAISQFELLKAEALSRFDGFRRADPKNKPKRNEP